MQLAFRWSKRAIWLTALGLAAFSCGGGPKTLAKSPEPIDISAPAPAGHFKIQPLEHSWLPPSYGAGRGPSLSKELAAVDAVALVLDTGASAAFEDRAIRMVHAAAPAAKIVARGRVTLNRIQLERGEAPYRTTLEPAGTDILGRPYYLPTEHPLNTDWLAKAEPLKGAGGLLSVEYVKVDSVTLKRMRSGFQGGCDEAIAQLDSNIGRAPAYFAPLVDGINSGLAEAFRRRLAPAVALWEDELEELAGIAPRNKQQCINEYLAMVQDISRCTEGPCQLAPKLFVDAGGVLAVPIIGGALPQTCADMLPRDYLAEFYELAATAAQDVLPLIAPEWIEELARLGGIQALRTELEKSCRPKHRRFDPSALAELNNQARQITVALGEGRFVAHLHNTRDLIRVPGSGPVRVLAQVRSDGDAPLKQVHAFGKALQSAARCDDLGERLIQATLVDVGTSEIRFSGIFFEEELLCEDLAP